jgi:hypothetical protein
MKVLTETFSAVLSSLSLLWPNISTRNLQPINRPTYDFPTKMEAR